MKIVTSRCFAVIVATLASIAGIDGSWFAANVPNKSSMADGGENEEDVLDVPVLDDPRLIANGAAEYAEMCSVCHLGPGLPENEFRKGLHPPAPELAKLPPLEDVDLMAVREFRIIKFGVANSAMPAWGQSHDDSSLWSIVAFLVRLPTLTPEEYARMTANSKAIHEALHRPE